MKIFVCFLLLLLIVNNLQSKCTFKFNQTGFPIKLKQGQNEPFYLSGLSQCRQYNGNLGCCDMNTDNVLRNYFIAIDAIFGSSGGGCDHCSINTKRFWCQFMCSQNQSSFMQVQDGYSTIPDPMNPNRNITVQKINTTVQNQTSLDLFNSCKKTPFVLQIKDLQTPSGFMKFMGHNSVQSTNQYIDIFYSINQTKSISFSDKFPQVRRKGLSPCNTTVNSPIWHQFNFYSNCTCTTCQQSCNPTTISINHNYRQNYQPIPNLNQYQQTQ